MKMKFKDSEHEAFYHTAVAQDRAERDSYRKALFYTLGLLDDTRRHIKDLYDFTERGIVFEGLDRGWQTSGSLRVCRLAFNLYNGHCGESKDDGYLYTPYNLFGNGLDRYMLEAVRVRFGED